MEQGEKQSEEDIIERLGLKVQTCIVFQRGFPFGHVLGHGIAVMHQSVDLIPLTNLTTIFCLTCCLCNLGRVSEDLLLRGAPAMTTCFNLCSRHPSSCVRRGDCFKTTCIQVLTGTGSLPPTHSSNTHQVRELELQIRKSRLRGFLIIKTLTKRKLKRQPVNERLIYLDRM